jgi:hypothetical protein
MAKATVDALRRLRRPEDVARARGKTVSEILPIPAAAAAAEAEAEPEAVAAAPPSSEEATDGDA